MSLRIIIGVTAIALGGLLLLGMCRAQAHDAPTGWTYSPSCCGGADCEPVPDALAVRATDAGWFIPETGETIGYTDPRLRDSPDGLFHRCRMWSSSHESPTRCLYRPSLGY